MGCPGVYYEEAIRMFAYSLYMKSDKKYAEYLYENAELETAEQEIAKQKENLHEADLPEYYFRAGETFGMVLENAEKDGCDGVNAALGGLYMFKNKIFGTDHP